MRPVRRSPTSGAGTGGTGGTDDESEMVYAAGTTDSDLWSAGESGGSPSRPEAIRRLALDADSTSASASTSSSASSATASPALKVSPSSSTSSPSSSSSSSSSSASSSTKLLAGVEGLLVHDHPPNSPSPDHHNPKTWIASLLDLNGLGVVILVVFLASVRPSLGARGGPLMPEYTVLGVGIAAVFFLSGLDVRPRDVVRASTRWRFHSVILLSHLVVTPAVAAAVTMVFGVLGLSRDVLHGVVVASCMPPAITTGFLFTRGSGGSEPEAVVAAVAGTIAGVLTTPALLHFWTARTVHLPPLLVARGLLTMLAPLAAGMLVAHAAARSVTRWKSIVPTGTVNRCVLLGVIYSTFCDTFASGVAIDGREVVTAVLGVAVCQAVLKALAFGVATVGKRRGGPHGGTTRVSSGSVVGDGVGGESLSLSPLSAASSASSWSWSKWCGVVSSSFMPTMSRRDVSVFVFATTQKSLTLGLPILHAMYGSGVGAGGSDGAGSGGSGGSDVSGGSGGAIGGGSSSSSSSAGVMGSGMGSEAMAMTTMGAHTQNGGKVLGMASVALLVYHPTQIIIGSFVVNPLKHWVAQGGGGGRRHDASSSLSASTAPASSVSSSSSSSPSSSSAASLLKWCPGWVRTVAKQWFLVGVVGVIFLASLRPSLGQKYGPLHPEITVKYVGVMVIFFNSGICMKLEELADALTRVRMHLTIQLFNLGFTPLLMTFLVWPLRHFDIHHDILNGLVIVACMPPPVSSAVLLTRAVGGNTAAAVCASAFGSFLGLAVTPMLLLVSTGVTASASFVNVAISMMITVVLPLAAGQVARYVAQERVARSGIPFGTVNNVILLAIIYTTFCDTFSKDIDITLANLFFVVIFIVAFQTLILALSFVVASSPKAGEGGRKPMSRKDVGCVLFTSTHKSLTLGMPMLNVMFGSYSGFALVSIPLLVYHPTQIVLGSVLAGRIRAWVMAEATQGTQGGSEGRHKGEGGGSVSDGDGGALSRVLPIAVDGSGGGGGDGGRTVRGRALEGEAGEIITIGSGAGGSTPIGGGVAARRLGLDEGDRKGHSGVTPRRSFLGGILGGRRAGGGKGYPGRVLSV